jgi:hypothetical protein
MDIRLQIRTAARKKLLFLPHAVHQMSSPGRMISRQEIHRVVELGDVIEDYQEDVRGHSCLLLGYGDGKRPIHVVCSPKEEYLAIITAYLPDPSLWDDDFRKRVVK